MEPRLKLHAYEQLLGLQLTVVCRYSLCSLGLCLFRFCILCVLCFSLDCFVLLLFAFVVLGLVSPVLWQDFGWEERLRKDQFLCPVERKNLRYNSINQPTNQSLNQSTYWFSEQSSVACSCSCHILLSQLTTLTIHSSLSLSLPAQDLPFRKSFPP